MNGTIDWSRLETAYLSGMQRPPNRPDTFSAVLGAQVAQRLGPDGHVQVRAGWTAVQQALRAARLRASGRAALERRRAVRLRDGAADSPEAWLLIESALAAMEAYVHVVEGDWDAAGTAMERVLHADADLRDDGYAILEMHRVQVAHNTARIALRRGDAAPAIELLAEIIGYLRGVRPWPLGDGRADPRTLVAQPAGLLSAMHAQLAGELGLVVARDDDTARPVLAALDRALGDADPRSQRIADVWRRMLAARLAGDAPTFAITAEAVLATGAQGGGILWHLTALDVLAVLADGRSDDPGATALARTIEAHSGAGSSAPLSVRTAHRTTRGAPPSP